MTLIDRGGGEYIDDETGEMFSIPDGTDACLVLARALFEAKAQAKAWEQRAAVAQAGLLERQTEKRVVYDDRAVSFRQNTVRKFDVETYRRWIEDAQVEIGDLFELAHAAKDIDPDWLQSPKLVANVASFRRESLGRPWLAVDVVRKVAPGGVK